MLRVLHVDDEPDLRSVVSAALQGKATVEGVGTLAAAQERLRLNGSDIVLLDLGLPDSQGENTVASLVRYGVPIVVFSGETDTEVLDRCVDAGAEDYISKVGVTPARLISRLRFVHSRFQHRQKQKRGRRLDMARLEALKPFISCPAVAAIA